MRMRIGEQAGGERSGMCRMQCMDGEFGQFRERGEFGLRRNGGRVSAFVGDWQMLGTSWNPCRGWERDGACEPAEPASSSRS